MARKLLRLAEQSNAIAGIHRASSTNQDGSRPFPDHEHRFPGHRIA